MDEGVKATGKVGEAEGRVWSGKYGMWTDEARTGIAVGWKGG